MVYSIYCDFKETNNEVEYEALIARMNMDYDLNATSLQVKIDSLLVVNQMIGEFTTKDSKMTTHLNLNNTTPKMFIIFSIRQIPRKSLKIKTLS